MNDSLPPCRANGQPANPCYNQWYDQRVEGRFDLSGAWVGWKIRAGKLIGPGGIKTAPWHLAMLWKLRNGLLEAIIADALNGPTILNQLRYSLGTGPAANDDTDGIAQQQLPGV